jgi:NADPH-dependent 2,4-dienoyl-CoA reductase/sulfur reductase-like enzyme
MTRLTRRQFGLIASASAAATLALPTYLRAQGKPRVVVIGGGAGGATAARYIAKDSDGAIDVTLIDEFGDLHNLFLLQSVYRRIPHASNRSPTATTRCNRATASPR